MSKIKKALQFTSVILTFSYMITVFASCTAFIAITTDVRFIENAQASGDYSAFDFWLPIVAVYTLIGLAVMSYFE